MRLSAVEDWVESWIRIGRRLMEWQVCWGIRRSDVLADRTCVNCKKTYAVADQFPTPPVIITKGLGLELEPLEAHHFPGDGEVGHIARHALVLYSDLLQAENETAKFMQALSLLEFLASPFDYQNFKEVKKVISRYAAKSAAEYARLLERFIELTGKKSEETGEITGLRTRIVHMGDSIERLVPDRNDRVKLFRELDGYIRSVLDHMIAHSEHAYDDYQQIRDGIRNWEA